MLWKLNIRSQDNMHSQAFVADDLISSTRI